MRNYIHPGTLEDLCSRIIQVHPEFPSKAFLKETAHQLGNKGLFERLELITQALNKHLPSDFPKAAKILIHSLGDELDHLADDPTAKEYDSNRGMIVIALGNFIAENGQAYFKESMNALMEMTKRFSSEGPIRQFLIQQEEKSLQQLKKWAKHKNVHVRRLVSEGSRPLLPWAPKLYSFVEKPSKTIALLDLLFNDKHLYVRRSVANHLNDIAKDHPELVVQTLKRWQPMARDTQEFQWMQKHALRTLIKKAHPGALQLIGISNQVKLKVLNFSLSTTHLKLGEKLQIKVEIQSKHMEDQELIVDYVIHHQKANGHLTPKVFKWTQKTLPAALKSAKTKAPELTPTLQLKKTHTIKEITTRKYYSGLHKVEIQINGKIFAEKEFQLLV